MAKKPKKATDRNDDDGTYAAEETSRANPPGVKTEYEEFEVNPVSYTHLTLPTKA